MKKSNIFTAVICAIALSGVSFYSGAAAGSSATSYRSQGKIVFNNNTATTADDVIFDASDFQTIDNMVTAGKNQIGAELNKYPSVNLDLTGSVPSFSELSNAVSILTNDADADGSMLLKDHTAYVKGAKIKGTVESKAAASYTPGTTDQTISQGVYLSGSQTIKGDTNLVPGNIVSGKMIFGVMGSHTCPVTPTQTKTVTPGTSAQTVTPDAGKLLSSVTVNAVDTQTKFITPSDSEQTATPDAGKFLSSVTVSAIDTQTKDAVPKASGQTITPDAGKYLSAVTVEGDPDLLAENIREGTEIFGVTGSLNCSLEFPQLSCSSPDNISADLYFTLSKNYTTLSIDKATFTARNGASWSVYGDDDTTVIDSGSGNSENITVDVSNQNSVRLRIQCVGKDGSGTKYSLESVVFH